MASLSNTIWPHPCLIYKCPRRFVWWMKKLLANTSDHSMTQGSFFFLADALVWGIQERGTNVMVQAPLHSCRLVIHIVVFPTLVTPTRVTLMPVVTFTATHKTETCGCCWTTTTLQILVQERHVRHDINFDVDIFPLVVNNEISAFLYLNESSNHLVKKWHHLFSSVYPATAGVYKFLDWFMVFPVKNWEGNRGSASLTPHIVMPFPRKFTLPSHPLQVPSKDWFVSPNR
jgi:hypothetical protein